jgi:hypothetical protein
MFGRIKCPHCREKVKKGATYCKHCHSSIGGSGKMATPRNDEEIRYLQNGFSKIHSECDAIEERINLRSGLIFTKHQYSSQELIEATERIDSFVGKMKDDLEEWDSANKLTQDTKVLFNKKANEVYQRIETIQKMIEEREPTWWEKVRFVIQSILMKLFPFLTFKMIVGKTAPRRIAA